MNASNTKYGDASSEHNHLGSSSHVDGVNAKTVQDDEDVVHFVIPAVPEHHSEGIAGGDSGCFDDPPMSDTEVGFGGGGVGCFAPDGP